MKILLDGKQCPICNLLIYRDWSAGPGKWFWCEKCGDYTIHPNQKFLHEVAMSRQED